MNIHLQLQTQIAYDLLRLRLEGTIATYSDRRTENDNGDWKIIACGKGYLREMADIRCLNFVKGKEGRNAHVRAVKRI